MYINTNITYIYRYTESFLISSVCLTCCVGMSVLQDSVRRPTIRSVRMFLVACTSAIWIRLQIMLSNTPKSTFASTNGTEKVQQQTKQGLH